MNHIRLVKKLLEAFGAPRASSQALKEYGLSSFCHPPGSPGHRRVRLSHAVLRAAISEIGADFGDEIPFLLLKGEPLETLLFADDYVRATGDVDLLILPGDLEYARLRLQRLGYRALYDEAPRMWVHNQQAFRHEVHGVVVELHWSVAEPRIAQPSPRELFETRVPFEFRDGLVVDVLRPDWLFFQLVLHFHHHIGFAKGLVDIAGWCDRFGDQFDTEEMLQRARRLGMYGMVQWPLHAIAELVGEAPPLWDNGADWFVRSWAALSAGAMRDCLVRPARSDVAATLVAIMPRVGPLPAVTLQALRMLTADGDISDKGRALLQPLLHGPHAVGRWVNAR